MQIANFCKLTLAVALTVVSLGAGAKSPGVPVVIKATIQCDAAFGAPQCSWSSDKNEFIRVFGKSAGENYEAFQGTTFSNEPSAIHDLMDASTLQVAKKSKCQYSADVTMKVSHPKVEEDEEGLPRGTVNLDSILATSGLKLSPSVKEQAMYGYSHCRP